MSTAVALPGFTDPVRDAQATFRAVLAAMAEPGSLHIAGTGLDAPAPLAPATAATLLTLVDNDVSLALDGALDGALEDAAQPARDWLAFHCGAAFTDPATARFVLATGLPDLAMLSTGSDAAPETACTVILQLRALGTGTSYRLHGPGLRAPVQIRIDGLPTDFTARWAANHALFPRGIDLILCAGSTIMALPRSASVEAS